MPVIVCEIDDHLDKHWECFIFVGLQDVEEVVIFEKAHCAVCHLEEYTANAADNAFEEFRNKMLYFVYLAYF